MRAARQGRKEKASMGENRKLKRQKVQARRAARAAAKGLDLEAVKQQLQDFVARGTDIEVIRRNTLIVTPRMSARLKDVMTA